MSGSEVRKKVISLFSTEVQPLFQCGETQNTISPCDQGRHERRLIVLALIGVFDRTIY
jgi:hypothetical protein